MIDQNNVDVYLRVKERVEKEIMRANRLLSEANGVDPNNHNYKAYKEVLRYAYEHKVSIPEARRWIVQQRAEKRMKRRQEEIELRQEAERFKQQNL